MKERNGNRYNLLFSLLGTSSSSSPSQSLSLRKYSTASGFTTVSLTFPLFPFLFRRNHLLHHHLHLLPIHRPRNPRNLNPILQNISRRRQTLSNRTFESFQHASLLTFPFPFSHHHKQNTPFHHPHPLRLPLLSHQVPPFFFFFFLPLPLLLPTNHLLQKPL